MKSHLSIHYFFRGKIALAYQTGQEALQLAKESGDIYSTAHANSYHGHVCYGKGYLEESKEHLKKGIDLAERINQPVLASQACDFLAETYYAMGEYKKSQKQWSKAISIFKKNSFYPSWISIYELAQARIKSKRKEKIDLVFLSDFSQVAKEKVSESRAQRYIGEILLNLDGDHTPEAEKWITKAIASDTNKGLLFCLGKDYALYADLHKRKNDLPKAKEKLTKAIEIFKECGADGWVEKYERELAELK
jgi:tetratricopeptide (TPR) repeat protein